MWLWNENARKMAYLIWYILLFYNIHVIYLHIKHAIRYLDLTSSYIDLESKLGQGSLSTSEALLLENGFSYIEILYLICCPILQHGVLCENFYI